MFRTIIASITILLLVGCQPNDTNQPDSNQNTPSAVDILTKKIAASPNDPELYFKRAQFFYQNDAPDGAVQDLARAIKLDSTQAPYYHLLADVYLDFFKSFDALRVMESAAQRFPTRIPTLLKLSEFQLILKRHEDSFETINKILELDPQNAEGWYMMGLNLKEINEPKRAITAFQSAVEIDPNLIEAWINLGQLYAQIDDPLALKYFNNALLIDPDNIDVLHAKAFYLNEKKRLHEALETYKQIILKNPNYEDAHFNSGLIYMEMDSLDQAIKQFDLLLEISPIYFKGYYYRGLTKEMKDDLQGAKEDYQSALKFSPSYLDANKALDRVEQLLQQSE